MTRVGRIAAVAVLALAAGGAFAAEQKGGLWEELRAKVEKVTPKRKSQPTTAVGGVRGAKTASGEDIYWKGKEGAGIQVAEEELAAFTEALEATDPARNHDPMLLFEKFLREYPTSSLRDDALRAVDQLKKEAAVRPPKAE